MSVDITAAGLSAADVVSVARYFAPVSIDEAARSAMAKGRAAVEALAASPTPVYGVSTGFGALAGVHIEPERRTDLQHSIIRSHAAGSGEPVAVEVVRALMLLRLRTICSGMTGVRPEVAELMAGLLNHGITPVVPRFGSLGCSGDLAPLSHCALALIGEGDVFDAHGARMPSAQALAAAGLTPVQLREKEGLALINGTDGMLGTLILALHDIGSLLDCADIVAAMSVEALHGTDAVFAPELHAPLRPHPGQTTSAENIRRMMAGSPIVASHSEDTTQVQDAYSLRCAPQVHGAVRDVVDFANTVAQRELAAVIDNPVVLPDDTVRSNGNFHGAPVAYACDFLSIVLADLASISERRTDRMLDTSRSYGLPAFLAHEPGVDSGLMIAQYTQAGLVAELKREAAPASVDSIPSSAMQEDHVSMGWAAAQRLRSSVDAASQVIAIELMAAARALDLRAPVDPSPASAAVVAKVRESVPGPGPDRFLAPEIAACAEIVRSGVLRHTVEAVVGLLSRNADAR
ncbi:MAG: histidine ammonia-lyase [Actinomycetales bacterium]|nr:histidine ammonia-lyase [Actinomycetales bacterium]